MPDNLVIVVYAHLFIIGKLKDGRLFDPRVVIVQRTAAGESPFMGQLVGFPTDIPVLDGMLCYTPKDEVIIKLYIQTTSGIVVP